MNRCAWVCGIVLGCLLSAVSAGCRKKEPAPPPQAAVQPPSRQEDKSAESAVPPIPSTPQEHQVKPDAAAEAKPAIAVIPESKDAPAQPAVLPAAELKAPDAAVDPGTAKTPDPLKSDKPVVIADDAWTQDYQAAIKKATAEKKDLLLNFTGSDWCPGCLLMEAEVLGKEEFKKAAGKLFVLVKIDFPKDLVKANVTEAMQIRNQKLKFRYGVQVYPTILLADGRGRPYAQASYQGGGPTVYLEHLALLQQAGHNLLDMFIAAAKADTPSAERLKLYDQALSQISKGIVSEFFQDEVNKVIELDPQNQAGLKTKYLIILAFNRIQAALNEMNFLQAKELIDQTIQTLNPNGNDAQNLYFARATVLDKLKDPAGVKESLQKALDADPTSEGAAQIRRILEIYFPKPPAMARPAKIQTNLKTYQTFLPERAFDGDQNSYFWAAGETKAGDQMTITLDQPGALQEIRVLTGSEQGQQGRLYEGVVEVSDDGQKFDAVGDFRDGIGYAKLNGRTVKAVRIRCTKNQTEWLIVREIELK